MLERLQRQAGRSTPQPANPAATRAERELAHFERERLAREKAIEAEWQDRVRLVQFDFGIDRLLRGQGGGSASLHAQHAFLMTVNGATFVVQRRGKSRFPVKGIFAESPATGMGQQKCRKPKRVAQSGGS